MARILPEPWMRGPLDGVSPLIAPVLYSFQQANEDLVKYTANMRPAQVWARPHGLAPLGFHLRHIAGSVSRLTMYLQNLPLTPQQFEALHAEMTPGAGVEELLNAMVQSFDQATAIITGIDQAELCGTRGVGRERLPTTVIGLLVHIAEHTQRHVGQAISAAKLVQFFPVA